MNFQKTREYEVTGVQKKKIHAFKLTDSQKPDAYKLMDSQRTREYEVAGAQKKKIVAYKPMDSQK